MTSTGEEIKNVRDAMDAIHNDPGSWDGQPFLDDLTFAAQGKIETLQDRLRELLRVEQRESINAAEKMRLVAESVAAAAQSQAAAAQAQTATAQSQAAAAQAQTATVRAEKHAIKEELGGLRTNIKKVATGQIPLDEAPDDIKPLADILRGNEPEASTSAAPVADAAAAEDLVDRTIAAFPEVSSLDRSILITKAAQVLSGMTGISASALTLAGIAASRIGAYATPILDRMLNSNSEFARRIATGVRSAMAAIETTGVPSGVAAAGAVTTAYLLYANVLAPLYEYWTGAEAKKEFGEAQAAAVAANIKQAAEVLKSSSTVASNNTYGGGSNNQQVIEKSYIDYVTRDYKTPRKIDRAVQVAQPIARSNVMY